VGWSLRDNRGPPPASRLQLATARPPGVQPAAMNPAALNSGSRSAPVSTMGGHAGRRRNAPDSRRPPGRSRPSHRGGRTPTTRFSGGVQAIADVCVRVTQARSSGSHTNSETLGGIPFCSVYYSPRHLSYLLSQRNVLCLNRNHLFRSIRLRFAHNALPTQRNLLNLLFRAQLMEPIKANLLSNQIGSFSQR